MDGNSLEAILAHIDDAEHQMQQAIVLCKNALQGKSFREWYQYESMMKVLSLLQKLQERLVADLLEKMIEEE